MKNITLSPSSLILIVVVLFAFKQPAREQVGAAFTPGIQKTIQVTGSADMLVPPDEVSIDITYREYWHSNQQKKKEDIDRIERTIVKAVNNAGLPTSAIAVNSEFAWKYRWDYWSHWYYYHNHLVQKNLTVKLSNATQLNRIIKNLKASDIRRQGIVNITLNGSSNKKIQQYRKMVKKRAMEAAIEKADYLLAAAGQKRGAAISISEMDDTKQKTVTSSYGHYGFPYWYDYYGWGHHGQTTTTSANAGISNSSVAMPSGGISGGGATSQDEMSMKPIKLRYEIQAVFVIENQ